MIRADLQGGAGSRIVDHAVAHRISGLGLSGQWHDQQRTGPVPGYSTDVASALKLVEQLVEEDPDLHCSLTRVSAGWHCAFRVDDWQVSATQSSLPLAIARAALELICET